MAGETIMAARGDARRECSVFVRSAMWVFARANLEGDAKGLANAEMRLEGVLGAHELDIARLSRAQFDPEAQPTHNYSHVDALHAQLAEAPPASCADLDIWHMYARNSSAVVTLL